MAYNKKQFKLLIRKVLNEFEFYSESAVNLLLGTAAQESHFGTYLWQIGGGPALGPFQMEPATHDDIWNNFISFRGHLKNKMNSIFHIDLLTDEVAGLLAVDLRYSIIMARLHYYRVSEPLPGSNDISGLSRYWKKHYNTISGKGTEHEFIQNYHKYVS